MYTLSGSANTILYHFHDVRCILYRLLPYPLRSLLCAALIRLVVKSNDLTRLCDFCIPWGTAGYGKRMTLAVENEERCMLLLVYIHNGCSLAHAFRCTFE